MKPKTQGKLDTIPSVMLYREDLDELLTLFRLYCETVTISDAGSEYESLDEMKSHIGSRVRNLELVGTKPNISLTLMSKGSWIRHLAEGVVLTPEEADKAELLFSRTKEFLLKRRRVVTHFFDILGLIIGCGTVILIALLVARYYPEHGQDLFVGITLSGVIPITALVILGKTGVLRHVTFDSKLTASTFWKRNHDSIGMLVIGNISGIAGTLLALAPWGETNS